MIDVELDATPTSDPANAMTQADRIKERRRRAFLDLRAQVVSRDKRTCRYCDSPATFIDQYSDDWPTLDTVVASCLVCAALGRWRFFGTLDEKRSWLQLQREQHTTVEAEPVHIPAETIPVYHYNAWPRDTLQTMPTITTKPKPARQRATPKTRSTSWREKMKARRALL